MYYCFFFFLYQDYHLHLTLIMDSCLYVMRIVVCLETSKICMGDILSKQVLVYPLCQVLSTCVVFLIFFPCFCLLYYI